MDEQWQKVDPTVERRNVSAQTAAAMQVLADSYGRNGLIDVVNLRYVRRQRMTKVLKALASNDHGGIVEDQAQAQTRDLNEISENFGPSRVLAHPCPPHLQVIPS